MGMILVRRLPTALNHDVLMTYLGRRQFVQPNFRGQNSNVTAKSDVHDFLHEPLQWEFNSTVIAEWRGREGKIGDTCFYPAWVKHAQPILDAMKQYNKAKLDLKGEYEKAKKKKTTKAANAHEYIKEQADNIAKARINASGNVRAQLVSSNRAFPYDIQESNSNNSDLMQLLCEGGELLQCKQLGRTEFGVCTCFDMEDGKPMYATTAEDGHCRGVSGSTCNGEDPVISTVCEDKLTCVSFSQGACEFEFGKKFHCSGYPAGIIGKQNYFCSRRTYHPEHSNDFAEGGYFLGGSSPSEFGRACLLAFINTTLVP
ncbi:unnamed protein product [Allacma fusca]|uniref:Uncharacterized protein n=1 Tax=Allacma fusca TaxID=39272 RepID=A0A8J2JAQ2_9HEXA|nr:unnamed protein product [Allacma fusca]